MKQEQINTTKIVIKLRESMTDEKLAKLIGISKVKLYTRLKDDQWSKSEIVYISNLYLTDKLR